jgi:hypothetical protein
MYRILRHQSVSNHKFCFKNASNENYVSCDLNAIAQMTHFILYIATIRLKT